MPSFVLELPSELASVPRARAMLAETAARWGCPPQVVQDACLVLTELLSNGVVHARTGLRAVAVPTGAGIRLEVHDSSPLPLLPRLGAHEPLSANGRGLVIVAALASSWGCSQDADQGKVVWAEIAAQPRGEQ